MTEKHENSKRIELLHIIDSLNVGGTEKQSLEIARNINREKFDLKVVTLDKGGPLYESFVSHNIPVTEFKMGRGFYSPKSLNMIFQLAGFMSKNRIKIVQTYGFYSTVPGVIAAKLAGVPVIICGERDMGRLLSETKAAFERFLWNFCDKIITNAHAIENNLTGFGIRADKVAVIHSGIDVSVVKPASGYDYHHKEDVVGTVGQFRQEKDHKTFIDTAAIMLKTKRDVKFVLIGSGKTEAALKEHAMRSGVKDSTLFSGTKHGQELYDSLGKFSVFLLTSATEGIPNALIESMAMGIPVVAYSVGGVPELVEDGVTGFLVPPGNPDILAEKALRLLEDRALAEKMGRLGRQKVEKEFDSASTAGCFEKLYDSLLHKKIAAG